MKQPLVNKREFLGILSILGSYIIYLIVNPRILGKAIVSSSTQQTDLTEAVTETDSTVNVESVTSSTTMPYVDELIPKRIKVFEQESRIATNFVIPLSDGIFRGYSFEQETIDGTIHKGVDINLGDASAPDFSGFEDLGATVIAAGDGTCVWASSTNTKRGNVVVLKHRLVEEGVESDIYTLYAHLGQISVNVQEVLYLGAELGTVGTSGLQGAAYQVFPHLHFEVFKIKDGNDFQIEDTSNRKYIDPVKFLASYA